MIAIIDYGMGNLHSVSKALERLGYDYHITSDKDQMRQAYGVILPGVGAFGDAMKQLKHDGLDQTIIELASEGKPLLGICLGMQLLFSTSSEGGRHEGLNLLQGDVARFSGEEQGQSYKVPHMGWNELCMTEQSHAVLQGVEKGYTYFVHSFYVQHMNELELLAYAHYHAQVPAIVGRDHIVGMQFHPEKSGPTGLKLLANFARSCKGVQV